MQQEDKKTIGRDYGDTSRGMRRLPTTHLSQPPGVVDAASRPASGRSELGRGGLDRGRPSPAKRRGRVGPPSSLDSRPGTDACRRDKPRVSFRSAVRAIQILNTLAHQHRESSQARPEMLSFAQLQFGRDLTSYGNGLSFDPSFYRAPKEHDVSTETKAVLSLPPAVRSQDKLRAALTSLRTVVEAFGEFPKTMQKGLVRYGWYESFGPGRIIIRQGQVPQNFYLLLTGTALVTKVRMDQQSGEVSVKTVTFLKQGDFFGDLAILMRAKRNATVVCKETVALLTVNRQDFVNIFMQNGVCSGEPEFVSFLRSLEEFHGWPLHVLPLDSTSVCIHSYFRRGAVICKDTATSDMLYVVKSGSVRVLKALAPAKRRCGTRAAAADSRPRRDSPGTAGPGETARDALDEKSPAAARGSGRPGSDARAAVAAARARAETHPKLADDQSAGPRLSPPSLRGLANDESPPAGGEVVLGVSRSSQEAEQRRAMDGLGAEGGGGGDDVAGGGGDDGSGGGGDDGSGGGGGDCTREGESGTRDTRDGHIVGSGISSHRSSPGDSHKVYVQVQSLQTGQIFGLTDTVFNESTSMVLVSEGAECVLISREFFRKHVDDAYIQHLGKKLSPYPSHESLQKELQCLVEWNHFKNTLISRLLR
ncbi:uncharacterized protein LOC133350041 isoform X2 [Lethenteron reissneri]|uniref:uncharacterized protein LOC133350041 isoform X2 n=1 Tax=Lethenteron reissneri TaxID=7753 RepID=UPI002AB67A56|nr:uncharacterized protein LOC133350041 isoform X2 [Lethenteron reissneri]